MNKKTLLLALVAFGLSYGKLNAQTDPAMKGSKLGVGAEFAFPTGDFKDLYDFGYGGTIQFKTPIANKFSFLATAGYLQFKTADFSAITFPAGLAPTDFGIIPLKVGAQYFLIENLYAGGEVGAAIGTQSGSSTSFVYTPHVGVEFPVADKGSIDFGARYEAWSNNGTRRFIGLRLAYNFGL